jgi:hypothetical protein
MKPEYPVDGIAPSTRHTITPGIASQIALRTLPNAVCTLRREGESDPAHGLILYADADGMIRFHARPSAASDRLPRLVIECEADGKHVRYPLELRASREPTPEHPVPALATVKPRRQGAHVRPALPEEEALRRTPEELLKLGYPLRPNPEEAPHAYNAWRRVVASPATFVEPRTVTRPDISHGRTNIEDAPESSRNWSGFELRGAAGTYDWVTGMWHVPSVTAEADTHTYSTMWIGLDGDNTTDLVQDGTEQHLQ